MNLPFKGCFTASTLVPLLAWIMPMKPFPIFLSYVRVALIYLSAPDSCPCFCFLWMEWEDEFLKLCKLNQSWLFMHKISVCYFPCLSSQLSIKNPNQGSGSTVLSGFGFKQWCWQLLYLYASHLWSGNILSPSCHVWVQGGSGLQTICSESASHIAH